MRKNVKKITLLVVVLSLLVSSLSVFSANVCYNVGGDLTKTVTFKVDVGKKLFSSEKIVLTQSQGSTRQTWYGKEKTVGVYGRFYVSVYDNTDQKWVISNQKWKNKTFTVKSSKLKKNHSYTVTVRGDAEEYVADDYGVFPYTLKQWYSYPTWRATKTGNNISFCG